MDRKLIFVLITLATPLVVSGAAFYALGPCPDGHHPGEFFRYHNNKCSRCMCDDIGYNCVTCGAIPLQVSSGCYPDQFPDEDYPSCCTMHICTGQPNFNQTKYEAYLNGTLH